MTYNLDLTEGLIPTHAGKTSLSASALVDKRAHPHSRGENRGGGPARLRVLGSSPLTRGKRRAAGRGQVDGRLIPTHAGKTIALIQYRRRARAHPHSRGENDRTHPVQTPR